MKYRLVMFDSDGTLADTLPWMRGIFNELAEEYGFKKVEPADELRLRDLTGRALLKELGLPLWKLPRVVTAMRNRMAQHAGGFSLFPGTGEMLQRLSSSGVTLGVVSSNSAENVRDILGPGHAALVSHFDCGASMFGKAAKIRRVVRTAKVSAAEALYIGDEIRDAVAAREAKVAFGAVTWGQHSAEALRAQNPAEMFHTIAEITERLGKNSAMV